MQTLTILAQGQGWIAVHKPAGMLCHNSAYAGPKERSALGIVRQQLGQSLFAVHRLDRATSGVWLLALDGDSARTLQATWHSDQVRKTYLAIVRGHLPASVELDHPCKDPDSGERQCAKTDFRCLAQTTQPWPVGDFAIARYSLVEAIPHSGRTHQIRQHLKHLSHPIIGDVRYGKGEHNRLFRQHLQVSRLLLHASSLQFPDVCGELIRVAAPTEGEFALAQQLFAAH
jgi:tRNA pseudouridine65 synthase